MLRCARRQNLKHQRTQTAPKPVMGWDVESDLLPLKNGLRQLISHQFLEKNLLPRTLDLQRRGNCRGEFNDAVIEERRPHFERVCHAHAIRLVQNIVGKKISLIEPQKRRQIIAFSRTIPQFMKNAVESARKPRAQESGFFHVGKGPVPINVTAIGRHQRALKKSLQLIFKTDLLVGDRPDAYRYRAQAGELLAAIGGQSQPDDSLDE